MKNEIDEIKVGEYVRLENGDIFKIDEDTTNYYNSNKDFITNEIVKHSPNLIELIEYGDLVKFKGWGNVKGLVDVIDMRTNEKVSLIFPDAEFCNGWTDNCMIYDLDYLVEKDQSNKIDWVLTHEQIKHNYYKVKE